MKPRTVMLTLELRDCDVPLRSLRDVSCVQIFGADGSSRLDLIDVAQATASVAQPSRKPARRKDKRRRRR